MNRSGNGGIVLPGLVVQISLVNRFDSLKGDIIIGNTVYCYFEFPAFLFLFCQLLKETTEVKSLLAPKKLNLFYLKNIRTV